MSNVESTAPLKPVDEGADQKDMFLKLLVAQLRNQNPTSPMEGTEFVRDLSQFTMLENAISSRQALESIRDSLTTEPASPTATNR